MKIQKILIALVLLLSTTLALGDSGTTFTIILDDGGSYDGRYPVATPAKTNDLKPTDATGGYNRSPDGTYYSKCGAEPYGCNFLSKSGADRIVSEAKSEGHEKLNRLDKKHSDELDRLQLDWEAIVSGQPPVQGGAADFVADLKKKQKQAAADLKSTSAKLVQTQSQTSATAAAKVQNATAQKITTKAAFNYTKAAHQPLQKYASTANAEGITAESFGAASNQYAAEMLIKQAEAAFKAGYPVAAIRMYDHARVLRSYQQGRANADGYTDVVLSAEAAERYGFSNNEIVADKYYGYGLISASNELARFSNISNVPQAHLLAFLHLQNANLARLSDNLPAFNNAIQSAWAVADYLKGFGSGIVEAVYDSASGMWQMISHPISTLENLTTAIINYDKTIEIISEQLSGVIDNYDNLSIEDKARLHGKITAEIGSMFLGVGALKKASDTVKIGSWLQRSSTKFANAASALGVKTPEGMRIFGKVSGAIESLPNTLKVQRVRDGTDVSKIAIIGRSMGNLETGAIGVRNAAEHLKSKGIKPDVFESSPMAWGEFQAAVRQYRKEVNDPTAMLPDEMVKTTLVYKENLNWVKRLKDEGFTVLDIGNPNNFPEASVFYEMEKRLLFNH